jgi:hypothetical protein
MPVAEISSTAVTSTRFLAPLTLSFLTDAIVTLLSEPLMEILAQVPVNTAVAPLALIETSPSLLQSWVICFSVVYDWSASAGGRPRPRPRSPSPSERPRGARITSPG